MIKSDEKKFFETLFDEVTQEIEYDPEKMGIDNRPQLVYCRKLPVNTALKFIGENGLRTLIFSTRFGNVVIGDQYPEDDGGCIIGHAPNSLAVALDICGRLPIATLSIFHRMLQGQFEQVLDAQMLLATCISD